MDSIFANRLRVVAERPGARLAVLALTAVLGAGLVLLGFEIGRHQAASDGDSVRELRSMLQHREDRIEELESRLADRTLSRAIDGEAYDTLRGTIRELRDELAETEEEVRFYRRLMAPSAEQRGLRIEGFELTRGSLEDELRYELMLTQVVERHDWIEGAVSLEVVGRQGPERVVLSLTDLADPEDYPLRFRFRYFQNFSGRLELPDGFTPERVLVSAQRSGAAEPLERSFDWAPEEG